MNSLVTKILDQLVAEIEAGRNPWTKSWKGQGGLPENGVTGHRYRGLNTLLLWLSAMDKGWPSLRFASFKQWGGQGRFVKKGEKGTPIIFYKMVEKRDEEGSYRMARVSWVFNEAQLDGTAAEPPVAQQPTPEQRHRRAADWVEMSDIRIQGGNPCYSPTFDVVYIPGHYHFESLDEYFSTLFHEAVHWTGHKKRLAREMGTLKESPAYAMEELVAEIGAAFMNAEFGIDTMKNNAAYLRGWLSAFPDKRQAIAKAAKLAADAFEYLTKQQQVMEEAA